MCQFTRIPMTRLYVYSFMLLNFSQCRLENYKNQTRPLVSRGPKKASPKPEYHGILALKGLRNWAQPYCFTLCLPIGLG